MQTDFFELDLQQSGSTVTGTLQIQSATTVPALSVTGRVSGSTFTYTATGSFGAGCDVEIEATTTVTSSGNRMTGPQTQTTCDGTAVGQMDATRR